MRGESMKDKSKKSTYSTTFGVDPNKDFILRVGKKHSNSATNKNVERKGFEPPTLWSQTRCASQTALPLEIL